MSEPSRGLSTATEGYLTKPLFSCSQDLVKAPKTHASGVFRAVEGSEFESCRLPHVTPVKLTSCMSFAAICVWGCLAGLRLDRRGLHVIDVVEPEWPALVAGLAACRSY